MIEKNGNNAKKKEKENKDHFKIKYNEIKSI